jgi:hypothetical protein
MYRDAVNGALAARRSLRTFHAGQAARRALRLAALADRLEHRAAVMLAAISHSSTAATGQPIDTGTAAGKCFLGMLGVFAEFETNLRRERQLEGIAKAKAAGVYKGRPLSIDAAQVRELKAGGARSRGDRQDAQDRPCVGLSGVGSRAVRTLGIGVLPENHSVTIECGPASSAHAPIGNGLLSYLI